MIIKKIFTLICLFPVILLIPAFTGFAQDPGILKKISGSWSGLIKIRGMELPMVMNISVSARDSLTITFDSPSQGAKDIPTSKVTFKADSVMIKVKSIASLFAGKFNAGYDTIAGEWKQSGFSLPLTLVKQEKKFAYNRPQEPKPPYPYDTASVVFTNDKAGITLAGTLTTPGSGGPFPAVILITGSGPQNRDEELLGHKPFLVLADWLTRKGIAVLRYDDRGIGKSGGDFSSATTLDFATDAEAAFDFLRKRGDIDTSKIGFIGHSEGGMIAPIVASRRPEVAFIVLMAGPGLPGDQILLMQLALISKAEGADDKSIQANVKLSRDIYTVLKKNKDNARAEQKIRKLFSNFDGKHAADSGYQPMQEAQLAGQIKTLTSPWFRGFLIFDPVEYLSLVRCPVLAINGKLDLQVPSEENLQAVEKALIFGGNSRYEIKELPDLNHIFQTAKTGSVTEYSKIEETMAPVALETISNWILGIVK